MAAAAAAAVAGAPAAAAVAGTPVAASTVAAAAAGAVAGAAAATLSPRPPELPRWRLRRAEPEDASAIHAAHMRSIVETCSRDYRPDQIDAWGRRPYDEARRRADIARDTVLVVEVEGAVEGFGRLRVTDGDAVAEIMQLYLTPTVQHCGAGKAVLRALVDTAAGRGASSVKLTATITALPFYVSQGFTVAGPQYLFPLATSGVGVECTPLVKHLTPGSTT